MIEGRSQKDFFFFYILSSSQLMACSFFYKGQTYEFLKKTITGGVVYGNDSI